MKNLIIIIIIIFLLIPGCDYFKLISYNEWIEKNSGNDEVDVYCAGNYNSPAFRACYWKNYNIVYLEKNNQSTASSIFIYGKDIYAGGFCTTTGQTACYWKNGERIILPHEGNSLVNDIFVKSGIVYCAGRDTIATISTACFWVNNIKYNIHGTAAISIFVDDAEVIHIGGLNDPTGFYWNSEMSSSINFSSQIASVYVSNSNVYLAEKSLRIFKNDFKNPIYQTGTDNKSIYVYNNDIYISENALKSYYLNNKQFVLTGASSINSLYVYNNTVYTAGYYSPGINTACYWKNQTMITLESPGVQCYAIDIKVVKKRY